MSGLGKGLGALISTEGMSSVSRSNPKRELERKKKDLADLQEEIDRRKVEVEELRKDLTIQLMLEGKVNKEKLFEMEEELKYCFDRKEQMEIEIERLIFNSRSDVRVSGEEDKGPESKEVAPRTSPSDEIDMRMVKEMMFGRPEPENKGPVTDLDDEGTEDDAEHIGDLIQELDQSKQAEAVRKEAYGSSDQSPPPLDTAGIEGDDSGGVDDSPPPSDPMARSTPTVKLRPGKVRIVKKLKKADNKGKDKGLYLMIRTAEKHLSKRDPAGAKRILHKALRDYPLDDELLYHLGNAYFLEGDLDQAEVRFRKSSESNPSSYRAFNNLGVVLRKKGEREAAIQAFNQALELKEDYERAWLNLGNLFMEIDPPLLKEARIFLRRALECDPDLEQARSKLEECERMIASGS